MYLNCFDQERDFTKQLFKKNVLLLNQINRSDPLKQIKKQLD